MDLLLQRIEWKPDGIFSELRGLTGETLFHTLEHAYPDGFGAYTPKLVDGLYRCVRGLHTLAHTPKPFEAFEITKVAGHSKILIHIGNFNFDSDGCVLTGMGVAQLNGHQALTRSKDAFKSFMDLQTGYDEFWLTVKSY